MMMETSKTTILNVDDFEPGLYAKSRTLRLAGFEVYEAMTGEDALRLAHELKPQLVLLDVNLPDVSGIEICRRIKTDPSVDSILVIQTSATFTEVRDRVRGLEGGADAYLTEPIAAEELIANIRAVLRLREAEKQVREREAWLKTVMSSIGDAVITTDLDGRVTLINPVAQEMVGWTEAEAVGRPLMEVFRIINEQTRQPSESPVVGVLQEDPSAGLFADQDVLIARDGREMPIENSAAPIKDERGNFIGVVLIFRDVTERRLAERRLSESAARYAYIFQTAGVSIWEEDFSLVKAALDDLRAQGVGDFRRYFDDHPEFVQQAIEMVGILDVNDETLRMFAARDKGELLSSLRRVFLPEKREVFVDELLALVEGRRSLASETTLRTLQGDRLDIIFTVNFLPAEGNTILALVSIMDITERKRMEKAREQLLSYEQEARREAEVARRRAEEASRSKDEFLATVSHELRTPLNHIVGRITMLRSGKLQSDKTQKAYDTIERSVRTQTRLIDDFLHLP